MYSNHWLVTSTVCVSRDLGEKWRQSRSSTWDMASEAGPTRALIPPHLLRGLTSCGTMLRTQQATAWFMLTAAAVGILFLLIAEQCSPIDKLLQVVHLPIH